MGVAEQQIALLRKQRDELKKSLTTVAIERMKFRERCDRLDADLAKLRVAARAVVDASVLTRWKPLGKLKRVLDGDLDVEHLDP